MPPVPKNFMTCGKMQAHDGLLIRKNNPHPNYQVVLPPRLFPQISIELNGKNLLWPYIKDSKAEVNFTSDKEGGEEMFFPVTIYDAEGKVKKVLSAENLHERHWRQFHSAEGFSSVNKGRKPEKPKGLKEKLDREFPKIPAGCRN